MIRERDHEIQHYVPKCYLKQWINENNKIVLVEKENLNAFVERNIYRSRTTLAEKDFYTLTINDRYLLNDEDLEKVFKAIMDCDVEYAGKKLTHVREYIRHYDFFADWKIIKSGEAMQKEALINEISNVRILRIEDYLDKKIETNWNNIVEKIVEKIHYENTKVVDEFFKDEILEFMVVQKWRTEHAKLQIGEMAQVLAGKLFEGSYDWVNMKRDLFLNPIYRYSMGLDADALTKELNIISNVQFVFYFATEGEFITSDTPCFTYINNDVNAGNKNGMYFTITPKILLFLCKNSDTTERRYIIKNSDISHVKFVNQIIKAHSKQFLVTRTSDLINKLVPDEF